MSRAATLGVEFVADEVVALDRFRTRVTAAHLRSGGTIEADQYVNAAGAWAKQICATVDMAAPIEPLRRFEHHFECQDPIERCRT